MIDFLLGVSMTIKKALVLAAGRGTRLRPLTHTMPKQVIPVANRPILHYVLEQLNCVGIREVGMVVSPENHEQIKHSIDRNPWDLRLEYIEQKSPLGLAHAVMVSRDFLKEESFLMYLGDNLSGGGLDGILHTFESTNADATLMLKEVTNPQQFGIAEIGVEGEITRLVEKPENPTSNLAIIGTYCFSPMIHQATSSIVPSKRGELEITDAIQCLLENGGIVNSESLDSWWFDCGTKDDLLEANKTILEQSNSGHVEGNISEDSNIEGQVEIGAGTRVTNSEIIGPVRIGSNSTIVNSLIGSETSIGSECTIKNSSIRRTILMDNGTIDNVTQIEKSVIGKSSNVISHSEFVGNIQFMVGDDSEILL